MTIISVLSFNVFWEAVIHHTKLLKCKDEKCLFNIRKIITSFPYDIINLQECENFIDYVPENLTYIFIDTTTQNEKNDFIEESLLLGFNTFLFGNIINIYAGFLDLSSYQIDRVFIIVEFENVFLMNLHAESQQSQAYYQSLFKYPIFLTTVEQKNQFLHIKKIHSKVFNSINEFLKKKKHKKFIISGDFNSNEIPLFQEQANKDITCCYNFYKNQYLERNFIYSPDHIISNFQSLKLLHDSLYFTGKLLIKEKHRFSVEEAPFPASDHLPIVRFFEI